MEYNLEEIGKRLRSERKAAGISSQELLAFRLEEKHGVIKRQTIGEWENGRKMPPLEIMLSLCSIYHCDLGYLLCEYDYRTRPDTDIGEVTGLSQDAISTLKDFSPDLMAPLNFMLSDQKVSGTMLNEFGWALKHLGDYKLACARTYYAANKDLLNPGSLDERREKYVENESNLDSLYAREYFANQSFSEAAKGWIRQKQDEVNDLSLDEMQKMINQKIQ